MESITASDNLTSIGGDAFLNVPWYDHQNDGVFYLGSVVCGYHGEMPEVTTLKLKDTTRGVAGCAFSDQHNLVEIIFPDCIENVGDEAFKNCAGLTKVVIPHQLENMGCEAFAYCTNLRRIDFYTTPSSCYNFIGCRGIKAVYAYMEMPTEIWDMFGNDDDPEYSQDHVFNNATLYVPSAYRAAYENTDGWKRFVNIQNIPNNICFSDENVKAICVAIWDTNEDLELSEEEATAVTSLGSAFSNNDEISSFKELEFFTGLTSLDEYAFHYCTQLREITIPQNVKTIGAGAFGSCHSLVSLELPEGITSVGNESFTPCGDKCLKEC